METVKVGGISIGRDKPLAFIAGPCLICTIFSMPGLDADKRLFSL